MKAKYLGSFGTPEYVLPLKRETLLECLEKMPLYHGPFSYLQLRPLFLQSLSGLFSHICLYFPIINTLSLHESPGRVAGPIHIKPGAVPLPQGSVWTIRFHSRASANLPEVPTRRAQVPPKLLLDFFPTGDEPKSSPSSPLPGFSPPFPAQHPWREKPQRREAFAQRRCPN